MLDSTTWVVAVPVPVGLIECGTVEVVGTEVTEAAVAGFDDAMTDVCGTLLTCEEVAVDNPVEATIGVDTTDD